MDKEKACLIIHPKAEQHVASIVNILEERWDTTSLVTQYAGHGMVLAENAPAHDYRWIIALGGDGTLNEVVNGFFDPPRPGAPDQPVRPGAALGILPRGTGGDLRKTIGLDGDIWRSSLSLRAKFLATSRSRRGLRCIRSACSSRRASSSSAEKAARSRTTRIPRPPPPAAALMSRGMPICAASC